MARTVSMTGASPCAMEPSALSGAVWVMASPEGVLGMDGAQRRQPGRRPSSPPGEEPGLPPRVRGERRVEREGGVDELQVGERLREVADLLTGQSDLLGVQP